MVNITLIGKKLARKGLEFIFWGTAPPCNTCSMRNICTGLELGGRYRITGIRKTENKCEVHEEGVVAVEYEQIPFTASLNTKSALEGSIQEYSTPQCRNLECSHRDTCFPLGIKDQKKYKIVKVGEPIDCPLGYSLTKVEMI